MKAPPYISVVVAARNDGYGGDFLHRLQVFLGAFAALRARHSLNAELLIVEWNPPPDRKPLAQAVTWPADLPRLRIVTVPNHVHARLPNSDRMPMFEYIAKNVGIRLAGGEFVLATNPDVLFGEALIQFLADHALDPHCFYRIDRCDVGQPVPQGLPVDDMVRFCAQHTLRVQTLGQTVDPWTYRELQKDARQHLVGQQIETPAELHTWASGDFFLMSRRHWVRLRGYPELHTHSFIDAYMCALAASAGLRQVRLAPPYVLYHQEHDRSEQSLRPLTDLDAFWKQCAEMLRTRRPRIHNSETWGLASEALEERTWSFRLVGVESQSKGQVESGRRRGVENLWGAAVTWPPEAMGFLEEANRQLAQGDLRAAKGALLRAHALAPESPQVLLALGNLCLTGGWHAEGAEAYTKLLRRDPAKVEVLLALGKCAFEAGDPASARDAYERVRALDPGNSLAAENLAVIHSGAWQGTGPERTP